MNVAAAHEPRRRRFTRAEYERMVDADVLGPDDRVELIEGEILVMSPEQSRHAAAIDVAAEALRHAFGPRATVRVQHPLALGPESEPEPDLAVVSGSPRDYADSHPTTALLVVEVADTSLATDRTTKALLYARAGIADYWIVNLPGRGLEVHRQPGPDGYGAVERLSPAGHVTPLGAPGATILVADLLV
ncbi:MAG: Uma2 family endonuclease [Deltaproteobacteria bacterium]|nr:Uma2 family endonuclease [Deltaproteobacteria bacterium]